MAKVKRQDKQTTLRFSGEIQNQLVTLGQARQQPIAEIIRAAILDYLKNNSEVK